jgi:hypothetical protein
MRMRRFSREELRKSAERDSGCMIEHGLPLFSTDMKQERSRCDSRKWAASETSHAGIVRIGFEGISQPHIVEHPCFNIPIESRSARFCKSASRNEAARGAL